MSVLVKGMKMPKSCAACQFRISYDESIDPFTEYCYITNEKLGYYNNKQAKWKKERRKNCPLGDVTREARHGKWITPKEYSNILLCSECNIPYEKKEFAIAPNYCPNCGALMVDEGKDVPMEYFENGGI